MGKEAELKKLWLLLLEEPNSLSDKQIALLLKAQKELSGIAYNVYRWFPNEIKKVQNYRKKKKKLSQLPIEELQKKSQEISDRRTSILRSVPDEDLSDSFFESSPLDSDESIIHELLKK